MSSFDIKIFLQESSVFELYFNINLFKWQPQKFILIFIYSTLKTTEKLILAHNMFLQSSKNPVLKKLKITLKQ